MNAPTAVTSAGVHALVRGSRLMTVLAPMVVLACVVMAVMAARLFRGDIDPQDLDPAAESTFDLVLEDPDVESAIDTWWATQLLAPVQQAYPAFHEHRPSEIAAELAAGLQRGDGYTLGIYSPAGAHAITPFATTREGNRIAI